MNQSSTPATTRNAKRVLTNGIAQFPVWIDVIDPLSASKRRIDISGMPVLNSDSDDSGSDEPVDLLECDDGVSAADRVADGVSSADFCCMTAQKYVLRGGQLQHADAPTPPPLTKQVADEAAHGSSTSEGTSGDDGSLSDDFIDKTDLSLTHLQAVTLMRFFPIMCQNMIENGI